MIILPIGREAVLTKTPWITLLLIFINTLIFFSTWPHEKKFILSRHPHSPVVGRAAILFDRLMQPDCPLPEEMKNRLKAERQKRDFPTPAVDEIFRQVSRNIQYLPPGGILEWPALYEEYQAVQRELSKARVPPISIFSEFGYLGEKPWPGLLTHQFLHAGFLHLFFNMLFLWVVGCNMEERWGPVIFLSLYISGGCAAALMQSFVMPSQDIPMVGASGAVAAVMGAFLIRHYSMKIKLFYFYMIIFRIRAGQFSAPAWVVLPVWFLQDLFMGLMTKNLTGGGTAYWAHVGGFLYGCLMGLAVRQGNVAAYWEKSAEETPLGLDVKAERAAALFREGNIPESLALCQEVLQVDPHHLRALSGILICRTYLHETVEGARAAVRLIRAALNQGQGLKAEQTFSEWAKTLVETPLTPEEHIGLGHALLTMHLWKDAIVHFTTGAEKAGKSSIAGKALYEAGKLWRDKLNNKSEAEHCFKKLLEKPFDLEWGHLAAAELDRPSQSSR